MLSEEELDSRLGEGVYSSLQALRGREESGRHNFRYPKGTRYLVIGAAPLPENPNVTVLPPASATAASVESAVLRIVGS